MKSYTADEIVEMTYLECLNGNTVDAAQIYLAALRVREFLLKKEK